MSFFCASPVGSTLGLSWLHVRLVSSACGQSNPKLFVLSPPLLVADLFSSKAPLPAFPKLPHWFLERSHGQTVICRMFVLLLCMRGIIGNKPFSGCLKSLISTLIMERLCTRTRFQTEAKGGSEMAYCHWSVFKNFVLNSRRYMYSYFSTRVSSFYTTLRRIIFLSFLRTDVTLKNNRHFAKAFNCPLGSRMNPVHKCKVW